MYKQQRFHPQHHVNRTMFLPALCSITSINESAAIIPRWPEDRRSETFSDEPVSPKVGCTGQVRRNGQPPIKTTSATAKYSKLKKIFSGRNLISAAAASLSPAILAASYRAGGGRGRVADACVWPRRPRVCAAVCAAPDSGSSCGGLMDVREMDPPLPVVKKVRKAAEEGGDGGSLWRRRVGGAAVDLKNLELQQIRHRLQLCTRLDRR